MRITTLQPQSLVVIRLNPGDDILLSIRKAVEESHLGNGLILEGAGSVSAHHYHVVSSRINPPEEVFVQGNAASDIININGMIIDGRVHAHITFGNDKVAYGGHLEEGTCVLTFAVVVIAQIDERLTNYDTIGDIDLL